MVRRRAAVLVAIGIWSTACASLLGVDDLRYPSDDRPTTDGAAPDGGADGALDAESRVDADAFAAPDSAGEPTCATLDATFCEDFSLFPSPTFWPVTYIEDGSVGFASRSTRAYTSAPASMLAFYPDGGLGNHFFRHPLAGVDYSFDLAFDFMIDAPSATGKVQLVRINCGVYYLRVYLGFAGTGAHVDENTYVDADIVHDILPTAIGLRTWHRAILGVRSGRDSGSSTISFSIDGLPALQESADGSVGGTIHQYLPARAIDVGAIARTGLSVETSIYLDNVAYYAR
jgi:hypothetical protein